MNKIIQALCSVCLLFAGLSIQDASAQSTPISWEHYHNPIFPSSGQVFSSLELNNGNFLFFINGGSGFYVLELDPYGRQVSDTILPGIAGAGKVIELSNGERVLMRSNSNAWTTLYRRDSAWNHLDYASVLTGTQGQSFASYATDIKATPDGGYILTYWENINPGGFPNPRGGLIKLNAQFQTEWDSLYIGLSRSHFSYVEVLPSGDYIISDGLPVRDSIYCYRISSTGTLMWEIAVPGYIGTNSFSTSRFIAMEMTPDNETWLTFQKMWGIRSLVLAKFDSTGNILAQKEYHPVDTTTDYVVTEDIAVFPDASGGALIRSSTTPWRYRVLKFNPQGDSLWTSDIELPYSSFLNGIDISPDGGFFVYGEWADQNQTRHPYVLRMDSLGHVQENLVQGKAFLDVNGNCVFDSLEPGLPTWMLRFDPTFRYAFTDANGDYSVQLDSGIHHVSILPLYSNYEINCVPNDTLSFYLPGENDTLTGVDIPINITDTCAVMWVEVSGNARICANNQVYMHYANWGSDTAFGAFVDVELDARFTLISTAHPYTLIGPNQYRFNLGDVAPFQTDTITMMAFLSCSTLINEAICNTAHIFPDDNCQPTHPAWNGASISVEGTCLPGDTIQFRVVNSGTANMLSPTGIIIVEDDILRQAGPIILNQGQDSLFTFAGDGSTWALFATQVPFHPYTSIPRAFVEGCGTDSSGSFSVGHVVTHAQDENQPYISIHCQDAQTSYDPNDKRGFPQGVGPTHGILQTDDMEYMIRFQNTGNDTAFKVVLRDQIPEEYDLGTFRLLSSSHIIANIQVYPDRVIEWTFDPIALPDSTTNELQSQGYVKFHLEQIPGGNPVGILIENEADIYFDHNDAVRTNTAWHTIYEDLDDLILVSIDEEISPEENYAELLVYPNPFREEATFELRNHDCEALTFKLFDQQGRPVRSHTYQNSQEFQVARDGLPAGIYIFRLSSEKGLVKSGKLLIR